MPNNEVRIIGGQWKGRKLKFPATPGLRPTLNRVRESLFNWLAADIPDARCLDLFAGSGALGFEALSRGAGEVTFVERDRKTAAALDANLSKLCGVGTVINDSAAGFLEQTAPESFDIVFFDPPFQCRQPELLLRQLLDRHLSAGGLIYIERPKQAGLPLPDRLLKQGQAGECRYGLLQAEPL